ncbi:hypothetical protein [Campylobacter coli]|nr:hypothetical protein [Campylobacter coli]
MFLANFLLWVGDLGNLIEVPWVNVLIENYSLEYIIYLLYSTIEWGIWNVGKYVLIVFIIIVVITTVLKLVKNYQSNKKVDRKNKEEQSYKVLIIDNNMENLFALKKESFIVEEVKIKKKKIQIHAKNQRRA